MTTTEWYLKGTEYFTKFANTMAGIKKEKGL